MYYGPKKYFRKNLCLTQIPLWFHWKTSITQKAPQCLQDQSGFWLVSFSLIGFNMLM